MTYLRVRMTLQITRTNYKLVKYVKTKGLKELK